MWWKSGLDGFSFVKSINFRFGTWSFSHSVTVFFGVQFWCEKDHAVCVSS